MVNGFPTDDTSKEVDSALCNSGVNVVDYAEISTDTTLIETGNGNSRSDIVKRAMRVKGRPELDIAKSVSHQDGEPNETSNITYSGCSVINCVPADYTDSSPEFRSKSTTFNNCKFNTYEISGDAMVVEGRFVKGYGSAMSALDSSVVGAKPEDLRSLVNVALAQAGNRSLRSVTARAKPAKPEKPVDKARNNIQEAIDNLNTMYGNYLNSVKTVTDNIEEVFSSVEWWLTYGDPVGFSRVSEIAGFDNTRITALTTIEDALYQAVTSASAADLYMLDDYVLNHYKCQRDGLLYSIYIDYLDAVISICDIMKTKSTYTTRDIRNVIDIFFRLSRNYNIIINQNMTGHITGLSSSRITDQYNSIVTAISTNLNFTSVGAFENDNSGESYEVASSNVSLDSLTPTNTFQSLLDTLLMRLEALNAVNQTLTENPYAQSDEFDELVALYYLMSDEYDNVFDSIDKLVSSFMLSSETNRTELDAKLTEVFTRYTQFKLLNAQRLALDNYYSAYTSVLTMNPVFGPTTSDRDGSLWEYNSFIQVAFWADSYRLSRSDVRLTYFGTSGSGGDRVESEATGILFGKTFPSASYTEPTFQSKYDELGTVITTYTNTTVNQLEIAIAAAWNKFEDWRLGSGALLFMSDIDTCTDLNNTRITAMNQIVDLIYDTATYIENLEQQQILSATITEYYELMRHNIMYSSYIEYLRVGITIINNMPGDESPTSLRNVRVVLDALFEFALHKNVILNPSTSRTGVNLKFDDLEIGFEDVANRIRSNLGFWIPGMAIPGDGSSYEDARQTLLNLRTTLRSETEIVTYLNNISAQLDQLNLQYDTLTRKPSLPADAIDNFNSAYNDQMSIYNNIFVALESMHAAYVNLPDQDGNESEFQTMIQTSFAWYSRLQQFNSHQKAMVKCFESYISRYEMGSVFSELNTRSTEVVGGSVGNYSTMVSKLYVAQSEQLVPRTITDVYAFNDISGFNPAPLSAATNIMKTIRGPVPSALSIDLDPVDPDPDDPVDPVEPDTVDQLLYKFMLVWDYIPNLRPSSELVDPELSKMNMFYDASSKEMVIRWTVPYATHTKQTIGLAIRSAVNQFVSTASGSEVQAENIVINHLKHGWIPVHDFSMMGFRSYGRLLNGFAFIEGNATTAIKNSDFTGIDGEVSLVTLESGKYKLDGCRADILEIGNSVVTGENCAIKSMVASYESTVSMDGGTCGPDLEHYPTAIYYDVATKKFHTSTESDTPMPDDEAMRWASTIRKHGCFYKEGTLVDKVFTNAGSGFRSLVLGFNPKVVGNTAELAPDLEVDLDTFGVSVTHLEIMVRPVLYQIGTIAVDSRSDVTISNARLTNAVITMSPNGRCKIVGCTGNFPATRHFERFNLYSVKTVMEIDEAGVYDGVQLGRNTYYGLNSTPFMALFDTCPSPDVMQNEFGHHTAQLQFTDCVFSGANSTNPSIVNSQTLPWYATIYYDMTGDRAINVNTVHSSPSASLELLHSKFLRCTWQGTDHYVIQGVADLVACDSTARLIVPHGSTITNCTLDSIDVNQNVRRVAWVENGVRASPMQIQSSDIGTIEIGTQSHINITGNGPVGVQTKFTQSSQTPQGLVKFDAYCHVGSTLQLGACIVAYPLRPVDERTANALGINTSVITFTDREVEFTPLATDGSYNNLLQVEFIRCKTRLMPDPQTSTSMVSYRFVDAELTSNTDIDGNYAFMYAERTKNAFARLEVVNHPEHIRPTNVLIDCKRPTLRFLETKVHKRYGGITTLLSAKPASLANVTRDTVNVDPTQFGLATHLRDCTDVNLQQVSTATECGAYARKYVCTKVSESEFIIENPELEGTTLDTSLVIPTTGAVMPVVLDSCNVIQHVNTSTFASEPVVLVYTGECTSVMAIDNIAIRSTFSSALVDASTVYVGYNVAVNRDAYQYVTHNTVFRSCNIVVDDVVYGINSEDEVSNSTDIAPSLRFVNNHFVSCKFTNTKPRTHSVLNPRIRTGDFNLMNPNQTAFSMPVDSLPARLYNHVSIADFYTPYTDSTAESANSWVPTNYAMS